MQLSIHASSLDKFLDCPRQAVASSYPNLLKDAGYEVKQTKQYVTGIIGNGIHAGADHLNQDYIRAGILPSANTVLKAQEVAYDDYFKRYLKALESGEIHFTIKFNSHDTVRAHIIEYVNLYANKVLPTRKIEKSEQYFKHKLTDDFVYSSTLDGYGDETLFDLKTGDKITPAYAQIGTYVYLLRASGHVVKRAQLDYLKRPKDGAPAEHVVKVYDPDQCMVLAQYATARLMSDLTSFQKTKDINVLLYNPRSTACNTIFCPLFGTSSCGGWRDK